MIVTYDIIADFTTQRYRSDDLPQWYRCAAISWSVTQVQSIGLYNLRLSRPAMSSHYESSRHARGRKERPMWLVSWSTQTTSRMGRSQGMDCQIRQIQGRADRTRGLTTGNDIVISSRNCTRYRDTKNSHNSSPKWEVVCHNAYSLVIPSTCIL